MNRHLRDRILRSRLLPVLVFPVRTRTAARQIWSTTRLTARWLFTRTEFANYAYGISDRNRNHFAWFVAETCRIPVDEVLSYFEEIESNVDLWQALEASAVSLGRRREFDREFSLGRRLSWYAVIRIKRPALVIETGTEKGFGSAVIAAALTRNGEGRLVTIDIEPSAGGLLGGTMENVVTQVTMDSVAYLQGIGDPIDLLILDSDHSEHHEQAELESATPHLSPNAIVISDNCHVTDVLANWSRSGGRRFLYCHERPEGHWYSGVGTGISVVREPRN